MVARTWDGDSEGQNGGDYRWCVVSFGKDGNILLDLTGW